MSLGSAHGVMVDFENNCMRGLRFGRAKRRIALGEEFRDGSPTQPPGDFRTSLDSMNVFAGPLREEVRALQNIAGGSRKIAVRSKLETMLAGSALRSLSVDIDFNFDLVSPTTWTLGLDEPASVVEAGADQLRLSLDRTASMTCKLSRGAIRIHEADAARPHPSWSFDLEAGQTAITIHLDVHAWATISDQVVICRPDQMREAAIALAAIPDQRFVPLMVLEPAPMTLPDLLAIFRGFRTGVDKALGEFGAFGPAEFGRKSAQEQAEFFKAWAERRSQQEAMQPYRSWAKRNTMLRKALLDFGIRKAICLVNPADTDLALTNVEYEILETSLEKLDSAKIRNLLDGIERVVLQPARNAEEDVRSATSRLDDLFDECRQIFGRGLPQPPVEAEEDDPAAIILGLHEARRSGRPLRIVPSKAGPVKPRTRISGSASGGHVVAIEVQDRAQSLIASLFAAELGTTLLTIPAPDIAKTERIVHDLQTAVVEWAQQSRSEPVAPPSSSAENRFLELAALSAAYQKFVYGDRRLELLRQLVAVVSEQIPPEFVKAVGDSALTVFGSGLPYSFVKQGAIDWVDKPIGHVIADPDLIVISERHNSEAIDPIVSFNVIIDPGFFRYSETEIVADALKARPAKSLILRKDARIAQMLPILIGELPLDFIFFNTHGNDQAIMLDFYPLQNFQITQWFEFDERPLIFNNSCMSWTGVGRDFVRVGARGYVGTLWSVGANAAAELAERSMRRMIDDGEPVCSAIRHAEVDPLTSRAYIFVGTAKASFSMDRDEDLSDDPVRLIAVMQNYLRFLSAARRDTSPGKPNAFTAHLYAELKALREGLIARDERYLDTVILDSILAEINLLNDKDDTFNVDLAYRLQLVAKGNHFLAQAALDDKERDRRAARLLFFRAEIHRLRHDSVQADADAKASIELEETIGQGGGYSARQVRIQIAIDEGRIDDALDLAQQTMALHQKDDAGERDREYELMTLGRLCQIMKRKSTRLDEAVTLANRGIETAVSLKNPTEESVFVLDLAQIYYLQKKPKEALEAAKRALAVARRASLAVGELAAYGTIGQCYLDLNDLPNARTYAQLGLERARELNEVRRVGAFLADLARLEQRAGDIAKAMQHWIDAIAVNARAGDFVLWKVSFQAALMTSLDSRNPEHCAGLFCAAIAGFKEMPAQMIGQVFSALLPLVPDLYASWSPPWRRHLFESIVRSGEDAMSGIEEGSDRQARAGLLLASCYVFFLVETGNLETALKMADELDQTVNAQGKLVAHIKQTIAAGQGI
jgi:tetratricopeptide (TPR) repeat protein